jgi:hypothetical protein
LADEQYAHDELLARYDRYTEGELDLYMISVRVGTPTRHR